MAKLPAIEAYRGLRQVKLPGGADHRETWTITEVLTGKELREEGRKLRHCVVSYSQSIARGQVSIWSLQVDDARKITIEVVNATKQIAQVSGRFNRRATPMEMKTIMQWAAKNGLSVSKWIRV